MTNDDHLFIFSCNSFNSSSQQIIWLWWARLASAHARVVADRARGKGGTGRGNVTYKGGATLCSSAEERSCGIWQQRFESITNSPNDDMDWHSTPLTCECTSFMKDLEEFWGFFVVTQAGKRQWALCVLFLCSVVRKTAELEISSVRSVWITSNMTGLYCNDVLQDLS